MTTRKRLRCLPWAMLGVLPALAPSTVRADSCHPDLGCCVDFGSERLLAARLDEGPFVEVDDFDGDGVPDGADGCPFLYDPEQPDRDSDGAGDGCDNCPDVRNADQRDLDRDRRGDACDEDRDADSVEDRDDNCPNVPNPWVDGVQRDLDRDGEGDLCDDDIDGDGLTNLEDACPLDATITSPSGAERDLCFPDIDGDGISEVGARPDICPGYFDPSQVDSDEDGRGDVCDLDRDGDGVDDRSDNCPSAPNAAQTDVDRDRVGDVCDPRRCFTPFGARVVCLDPSDALAVFVPDMAVPVGRPFFVPFLVNRLGSNEYSFELRVLDEPAGGSLEISETSGLMDHHVLGELAARAPLSFTASGAGVYSVSVEVTQFGGPSPATASHLFALHAREDRFPGCADELNSGRDPDRDAGPSGADAGDGGGSSSRMDAGIDGATPTVVCDCPDSCAVGPPSSRPPRAGLMMLLGAVFFLARRRGRRGAAKPSCTSVAVSTRLPRHKIQASRRETSRGSVPGSSAKCRGPTARRPNRRQPTSRWSTPSRWLRT